MFHNLCDYFLAFDLYWVNVQLEHMANRHGSTCVYISGSNVLLPKCPNEDCSLMQNDVCSPGHTCTYPEGADFMYVNQNYGKCLPSKNQ